VHAGPLALTRLPRRWRASAAVGIVSVALIAASAAPAPADASASGARGAARPVAVSRGVVAPVPALDWHKCFGGLRCTRADVPLDYDDPTGPTTSIFMSMRPADDQARRIGALFVNPGGPGGPSSQLVSLFARALGPVVRDRFDIIGIDPRGVGRSRQLRCRSTTPAPAFPRATVPLTLDQARPLIRYDQWVADACAEQANDILDHMTTADTARDMDLVRQAVGDNALSYYGISYGTYLGATFAAMFPDQVRAVVLDGVLDPVAWSTGREGRADDLPFSTRLRSGVGAWEALTSAFAECDRVGLARCRYAGAVADQWRQLVRRLRQGPVRLGHGQVFTYSDLVGGALGALYDRRGYRPLFHSIAQLHAVVFPAAPTRRAGKAGIAAAFRRLAALAPDNPYAAGFGAAVAGARASRVFPSFEGVACSDSINPTDPTAWVHAGAVADRQGPWFGRVWTWASGPCATWPASKDDAFTGPWRTTTAEPLLVLGNFHDPATPISGARTVNTLFAGSRMISLNTWGHGAIGQSDCVATRVQQYLVHGLLPANGLVCQPNRQLFPRH
jgi:pimeloyl-ACP methyl ester carboxylesterase